MQVEQTSRATHKKTHSEPQALIKQNQQRSSIQMAQEIDKLAQKFNETQTKKETQYKKVCQDKDVPSFEVTSQSSRKKEENSVRIRDNLLNHIKQSGFKEGFNQIQEEEESKQETILRVSERASLEKQGGVANGGSQE